MTDIFISYATPDRQFAQAIAEALTKRGISVFADIEVPADADLESSVLSSLRSANTILFVVPKELGGSQWTLYEVGAARAMGKKIIGLMPHGKQSGASDVAFGLSDILLLDVRDKKTDEIARLIHGVVSKPKTH